MTTPEQIQKMNYVDLMAFLEEVNRPPGGKDSVRILIQNCFLNRASKVLDAGCNTGYLSFEMAHIAQCKVIGVDINENMIKKAEKAREKDLFGHLIKFKIADATNLPFKTATFDVVVSGGSTAFIDDKIKTIEEYRRVLKPWGFVADINFFYRIKPPTVLINRLNSMLGIEIKPWDINYWLNLYGKGGLEKYFIYTNYVKKVSAQKVKNYCSAMTRRTELSKDSKKVLEKRLISIMNLFNENHKYLDYGVFIYRKRPEKEQISLFGA